jgi:hypothetical protein
MGISKHSENVVALSSALIVGAFTTYSPEVGSEEWCDDLKAKPRGDWGKIKPPIPPKAAFFS